MKRFKKWRGAHESKIKEIQNISRRMNVQVSEMGMGRINSLEKMEKEIGIP